MTTPVAVCLMLSQFVLMIGLAVLNWRIVELRRQVSQPSTTGVGDWISIGAILVGLTAIFAIVLTTVEP